MMRAKSKRSQTDFPGMMDDPGSFSGSSSSPSPHRGPEARYRMSFAIFIRDTATTLSAPEASTMASWAARASNYTVNHHVSEEHPDGWVLSTTHFVRSSNEVVAGDLGDLRCNLLVKTLLRIQALHNCQRDTSSSSSQTHTVPTAVPPCASMLRFFKHPCTLPIPLATCVTYPLNS
jgi:hypothetical protein